MSTEFINDQWRLPNAWNGSESNVNKQSNYSMDFDGSSQYIQIAHNSYFDQSLYSFSFWINNNLNSGASNDGIITADSSTRGWSILQDNQTLKFNPNISGGSGQINITNFFNTTSTWIHCAITFDGTNLIVYKNGTSVGSSSSGTRNLNSNNNPLTIGNNIFTTGRFFNGKLDGISLFNYALSASQVTTLYGSSSTGIGNPMSLSPKPVAMYNLGDKSAFNGANYLVPNIAAEEADGDIATSYSPYALNFDSASSDYIDLGNNVFFNTNNPFTFSAWVNLDSYTTTYPYIANLKTNVTDGFTIFLSNHGSYNGLNIGSTDSSMTKGRTTGNIASTFLNSWNHIAVIYNGSGANTLSNYSIYVNGSPVALTTTSVFSSIANANNLGRSGNNSFYLDGSLSNASIWNTALTSAQISELYNEGVPSNLNNHSAYSNLVSWWQLGSNSSFNTNWTVLDEVTASGNNGTSVNMTEDAIVDGVGSYANGLSSGMGGDEVIGDAPYSTANSLSVNMDVEDRVTDTPS